VSKAGAGVLASADEDTWGVYVAQSVTCNVGSALNTFLKSGQKAPGGGALTLDSVLAKNHVPSQFETVDGTIARAIDSHFAYRPPPAYRDQPGVTTHSGREAGRQDDVATIDASRSIHHRLRDIGGRRLGR
jgi:hypothetical protein